LGIRYATVLDPGRRRPAGRSVELSARSAGRSGVHPFDGAQLELLRFDDLQASGGERW
jgi:hypothetical protein